MGHATRTKSRKDRQEQLDVNKSWMDEYLEELHEQALRQQAVDNCEDCKDNPVWERRTQFAGNHPFCDVHARTEPDFGEDGGSYYYWSRLDGTDGTS